MLKTTESKLSSYTIISKNPDFYLLQHKTTGQKAYYKEYFGARLTSNEYQLVSENFKKRQALQSSTLLEIIDYSISKQEASEASDPNYKFGLIYEYWTQNFQMELTSKLHTSYYWTEEELLNTIEATLQSLWLLHTNGITHGDIKSCNIVVNEEGLVKLADQFVTSSFYKKSLKQIIDEKSSLVSPEMLEMWQSPNLIETPENDIWALGMIFLEAACLIEIGSCYDWEKKKVDFEVIEKRMEFVKKKYGDKLIEIFEIMLSVESGRRREVFVFFGLKKYESVERESLCMNQNDMKEGINECIISPKSLSVENLLIKHKNSKEEFVVYIRKEIDRRQKSLDRLENLLKQAEKPDENRDNLHKIMPLQEKTDVYVYRTNYNGSLMKKENKTTVQMKKSLQNNELCKTYINNEKTKEKTPCFFQDKPAILDSISLQTAPSFNKMKYIPNDPKSNQKKSSLSLIKDRYFQDLREKLISNIKTENKENEEKFPDEIKKFDDFSIIKNEESLSISDREIENSMETKNCPFNKTLPFHEETQLNNNHLKTLNRRVEECLIKGNNHSQSPSDRSFEMKNSIIKEKIKNFANDYENIENIANFDNIEHKYDIQQKEIVIERPKIKKISYENGDFYEGEVLDTIRSGYGTLYSKSNRVIYQGEWEDDFFNGHGVKHNLNVIGEYKEGFPYGDFNKLRACWIKYEGGFLKGKKHGSGVLILGFNEYFQGIFQNDKINGKGTFQTMKGKRVIGEWNNNKLIHKIN